MWVKSECTEQFWVLCENVWCFKDGGSIRQTDWTSRYQTKSCLIARVSDAEDKCTKMYKACTQIKTVLQVNLGSQWRSTLSRLRKCNFLPRPRQAAASCSFANSLSLSLSLSPQPEILKSPIQVFSFKLNLLGIQSRFAIMTHENQMIWNSYLCSKGLIVLGAAGRDSCS